MSGGVGGLVGWLAGWMAGWLAGWPGGWVGGWLVVCLFGWLVSSINICRSTNYWLVLGRVRDQEKQRNLNYITSSTGINQNNTCLNKYPVSNERKTTIGKGQQQHGGRQKDQAVPPQSKPKHKETQRERKDRNVGHGKGGLSSTKGQ